MSEKQEYWFNLKTNQVECGKQSLALDRVGPFASAAEAADAKRLLAERAATWRAEEDAENKQGD